jgi:hypothetical protein
LRLFSRFEPVRGGAGGVAGGVFELIQAQRKDFTEESAASGR